jgi:hypothetical protein
MWVYSIRFTRNFITKMPNGERQALSGFSVSAFGRAAARRLGTFILLRGDASAGFSCRRIAGQSCPTAQIHALLQLSSL